MQYLKGISWRNVINTLLTLISLVFSWVVWRDSQKNLKKKKIDQLLSEKELPCSIPVDSRYEWGERAHCYSELKIHRQLENGELDWVLMDYEGDVVDSYQQAIVGREKPGKWCNFYSKQGILDYLAINHGCEVRYNEINV